MHPIYKKVPSKKKKTRAQVAVEEVHKILGLKKWRTYLFAIAAKMKHPEDLVSLANEIKNNHKKTGEKAYRYLLGMLKIKSL